MPYLEPLKRKIINRYEMRTPASKSIHDANKLVVPGGDTRAIAHFDPYPFFADRGYGCYLADVDGNEYIDCVNNMTALVHGHGHPAVVKAICDQARNGTSHSAPVEVQHKLARHLCDRIPSLGKIRFCNCGTEATLFALRAARAFTGRDVIIKMDGGYHGGHDGVQVNVSADVDAEGLPRSLPTWGVPKSVAMDVIVAPFNDLATMDRILSQNRDRIAAIITEPIFGAGGGAMAQDGYLEGLRTLADQHGVLLIFDEVITLRVHEGGYESVCRVKPDLIAMGKLIGGGLPIGAFGGREDVMAVFDHTQPKYIVHSGTFTGNALTMKAGFACMENFMQPEINRINALGDRVRVGLTNAFKESGVKGNASGYGSLVYIYFFNDSFKTGKQYATLAAPTLDFLKIMNLALLNTGLFCMVKGFILLALSTPMDEVVADEIINKFKNALEMVAPLARE